MFSLLLLPVDGVKLVAFLSQHGLHGEIRFSQQTDNLMRIETALETTLQYPDQVWSWSIHQFPVDYSDPNGDRRCSVANIGQQLVKLDDTLDLLVLPGNESSIYSAAINITGKNGVWGKSIVFANTENSFRVCATITTIDENMDHIAEARFHSPVAGSIYFRWLAAKDTDHRDTLIYSNLFHVQNVSMTGGPVTQHLWKIYVTDIFDSNTDKPEINCNILQLLYDPQNVGSGKSIGDIDLRVGALHVAKDVRRKEARQLFQDDQLMVLPSDLSGPHRQLFIVIYDPVHHKNFMACAKIRNVRPRVAK